MQDEVRLLAVQRARQGDPVAVAFEDLADGISVPAFALASRS